MGRTVGELDDILLAVKRRLIDQIEGCNDATCYLCLNPDEYPPSNPGKFFYAIAPMSGTMDEAMFDGGGQNQMTVLTGLFVRVYSPVMLDQPGRDTVFLTSAALGIIGRAQAVLRKLAGWDPQDEDEENELTRDPLIPSGFDIVKPRKSLGAIDVQFKLTFDWDLTSDDNDA